MPRGNILLFLAFLSCLKPPPLHLAYLDCLHLRRLLVSSELNLSSCYFSYSFFFIILFIYFQPRWVLVTAGAVLHLRYTGGHSPAAVCGPLLCSTGSRRPGFSSCSSWPQSCGFQALGHRLSSSAGGGVLPDQGLTLGLMSWQEDSLPVS